MRRTRRRRLAAFFWLSVLVCLAGAAWRWRDLFLGPATWTAELVPGDTTLDEALTRYRSHFAFAPDRRFQTALRDIDRIATGKPAAVEARATQAPPGWDLVVGGKVAGHVSTLPTFPELFAVLVSHAKEALASSRVVAGRAPERPHWPDDEFLPDSAFPALAALQASWNGTGRNTDNAERAAKLLTGLLLQARTRLDVDDPLAARTLAALAVARSLDPESLKSEECLAAWALDYSSHCLSFSEADNLDPAVHSFIEGHVSQLSALAKATPRGRYLELLLLLRTQDPALWRQAVESWKTSPRDKAFVLGSALERVTADTSEVPFEVLTASTQAWLGQDPPEDGRRWALGLSSQTLRAAQNAAAKFDGVYLDREVAFAVDGSLVAQALYGALSYPLNVHSSPEEARAMLAALPQAKDGLSGELRDWLEHKTQWYEGKDVTAWREARAADPSFVLGARGRSALLGDSGWVPSPDEPDLGARELLFQVFANLDSRPEHRAVALPFVRNRLRDAARADWLETSLARDNQLLAIDAWVAALGRHVGPKALRSEVLSNQNASKVTLAALRWLGNAKALPEVGPIFADLWRRPQLRPLVYPPYASYLSGREDYPAAERLAREYLVDRASDSGITRELTAADLAASLRQQGRQQEAWQTIEPALRGGTLEADHEGVLSLLDLGRTDEAESLARAALARHPEEVELRAALAAALWRAGRWEDAARAVTPPEAKIGDDRFGVVVAHFGYALHGSSNESALAAFDAFARHAPQARSAELAAWFDAHDRHDLAHEMYARLELVGEAWLSLRAAKGEDEATRWARSLSLREDAARGLFAAGAYELLWAALPDAGESLWSLRAAAVVRDPEAARRHGAQVKARFDRVPRTKEQYLARLMLGLEREPALLQGKLGKGDLCQVAWALGLAAEGRDERMLAIDYYEVAASTGEASLDCFRSALRQLDEWRRGDLPFEKSWTPKLGELFAELR